MTKKPEALRLAECNHEERITMLACVKCGALVGTQPEQEPVATVTSESGNPNVSMSWWHEPALPVGTKIYTSPQRKPLTDEEIWKFWWSRPEVPDGEDDSMEAEFVAAVRRVLAAHGIKGET